MSNLDLFEPERRSELDQYFTEAWIARRAARWIPRGVTVLEPSCGSGNLIEGLLLAGHRPEHIVACELDPAWKMHTVARFEGVAVTEGDFLAKFPAPGPLVDPESRGIIGGTPWRSARLHPPPIGASLQNPPYGDDLDLKFVDRTLSLLERNERACVVAVLKTDFEYSDGRAAFWRERARVRRRALLVERPRFGAHVDGKKQGGAERNYVVLELVPRVEPRAPGAAEAVIEERWSRTDPESCWTGPFAEVAGR